MAEKAQNETIYVGEKSKFSGFEAAFKYPDLISVLEVVMLRKAAPRAKKSPFKDLNGGLNLCGWSDSNRHGLLHYPLKIACIPISPHPRI